jgi:uncharacterized protein (TIGR03000 family)
MNDDTPIITIADDDDSPAATGATVAGPHGYDELMKPRDGSGDQALRPWGLLVALLLFASPAVADDGKAKAAWAWSVAKAKPVSAWVTTPTKAPPAGCTCKPCTCVDGCKCALPAKGDAKETDAPVTLKLTVPNTARVWLQGQEIPGSGNCREFVSPKLKPGEYVYTIKVRDAYGAEETVELPIRSGQTRELNFRAPENVRLDRLPPIQFGQPVPMMGRGVPCPPSG